MQVRTLVSLCHYPLLLSSSSIFTTLGEAEEKEKRSDTLQESSVDGPVMNPLSLLTSSSSPTPNSFPLSRSLSLRRVSPPPPPSTTQRKWPFCAHGTVNTRDLSLSSPAATTLAPPKPCSQDAKLLTLLRQRKTEEAWVAYTQSAHLPNPTCLSRLVSQLSYQKTLEGLRRAQSILTRLRDECQLRRLDANSLGLLAVAATKAGQTLYASSVVKSMLRSGYLPHVKAWSAVVSRLAASGDDGPEEALRLFEAVTRRLRKVADPAAVTDSRPDTAALNACANLGDRGKFSQLFDEMPVRNRRFRTGSEAVPIRKIRTRNRWAQSTGRFRV